MKHFLAILNKEDLPFVNRIIPMLKGCKATVGTGNIKYATQVEEAARKIGAQGIFTTNQSYLATLLPPDAAKTARIHNYAGSLLASGRQNLDVLVLNPLRQTYSVPYGAWLMERQLSKIVSPESWREVSKFSWVEVTTPDQFSELMESLDSAVLVGVDIETLPPNTIEMVGYTTLFDSGESKSYVIYIDSLLKVEWMRQANAHQSYKVMQNGRYDAAHFFAWSAPIVNYIADTAVAMHAWQAELPKDLGFLTQLLVRNSMYWKDLGRSTDRVTRMEYCALDTWGTAEAFMSWLAEAPDYAKTNFITKMRLTPAIHACEMRGIKRDEKALYEEANKLETRLSQLREELSAMVGVTNFNPNSHVQVKTLMMVLGHGERGNRGLPKSSNEKALQEAITKHPLSERIFSTILECRSLSKLLSTYLTTGTKAKEYKGRVLYSINPSGTDTGRASSAAHHFWCGLQIQNIPREGGAATSVKRTLIADPGYLIFEIDKEQAEARGVAYCSGDLALIEAVDGPHDFHSLNAAAFFGVPYESIRDDETNTTLNVPLRELAKGVNHGSNYNMGERVLLETMGSTNVRKSQQLLGLSPDWTLLEVCRYLLNQYATTYPTVKTRYYNRIVSEVMTTNMLVGATGWTRYCFGNPTKSKLDLNSYVAHVTQSLNAMDLDQGFIQVFNWQRKENNWDKIQVFAQIHDSILGQVREDSVYLVEELAKQIHNPIEVTCSWGITRTLDVPLDISIAGKRWGGN